ncbi:hypothetical protein BDK51DRAFT_34667, partial [Blyttiomyces helicus]
MKASTALAAVDTATFAISGVAADLSKFQDFSQCEKIITRKEIHDVTPHEWAERAKAVRTLATTKKPIMDISLFTSREMNFLGGLDTLEQAGDVNNLTIWEQIAYVHFTSSDIVHDNNIFLLFHRKIIARIEQMLIEGNPKFGALFYWATEQELR